MSTLYLDRRDLSLELQGRTLVLRSDGVQQGTVPLRLLERVVMRSSVGLDSSLLARLADAGVGVLIFGGLNASKLAVIHGRSHNDGARRVGQYRRYDDPVWRQRWSRRLVRGKLRGQGRVLTRALAERPDLRLALSEGIAHLGRARARIAQAPESTVETLRGIEGAAAAAYFKAYVSLFPDSLGFSGRNRRPPRDPVNAVLSLGYTLLHFEAVRAIYAAGLDPVIGYFHALSFGRESLACDLVEPLRPYVDAWTWQQFRSRGLREEHFSHEGDACLLGKAGRQHFYRELEPMMRPLRRLLRRVTGKLAVALAQTGGADAPTHE